MIHIYALCCPITGNPRYIGKCKNLKSRLSAHISKAKGHHTNHHCANWIRSVLKIGLMPTIISVRQLDECDDWESAEKETIRQYLAEGHDLTNLTGGGDGFHNCPPDLLKRRGQSRSKSLQNPDVKAKFVAAVGPSHSTEWARKNHRNGAKAAWADPIKRERMLAGMRTPEARARRSKALEKRNSDPDFALRHKRKMQELFSDPTRREQLRQASLIRWKDRGLRQ